MQVEKAAIAIFNMEDPPVVLTKLVDFHCNPGQTRRKQGIREDVVLAPLKYAEYQWPQNEITISGGCVDWRDCV